jgi:hypothetical protein
MASALQSAVWSRSTGDRFQRADQSRRTDCVPEAGTDGQISGLREDPDLFTLTARDHEAQAEF